MGIKHYDVDGVADTLQLGKRGPSLKANDSFISALGTDGKLTVLKGAEGTDLDSLSTCGQVQTGLSLLQSQFQINLAQLNTQLQASLSDQANTIHAQAASIEALQAMVNRLMPVAPETYAVGPSMPAGTLLGNLKDGSRVASISVEVKEAFDGNAALEVGDGSKAAFYMDGAHSDLQYVGTYTMTPPEGSPDSMITATLTGSATTGSATIRIEYA